MMPVHPDPKDVASGSDEAARWVADALENSQTWFPGMPEPELRGPLEQAFDLANQVGRGEREFHEVFEAELRRAVEERDVLGAAGSVLPGESAKPQQAFRGMAEPEPSEVAEPVVEEAEPVVEEAEDEDETALSFALELAALRFRDELSSGQIEDQLGVTEQYYADCMRWLLDQVEDTPEGEYPAHLNRAQMRRFAANLESVEERFSVGQHVRDCRGCANYLADLRAAALAFIDGRPPEVRPRRATPPIQVSATELRKYRTRSERREPVTAPAATHVRRPGPRRLVPVVVCGAVIAVATVTFAALSGGDQGGGDASRRQTQQAREATRPANEATQRRREAVRERAERQRARRALAERRAAAAKRRRAAEEGRNQTPSVTPTPSSPPDQSVTPPAPSAPPPTPPPDGSGGEFGPEP